MYGYHTNIKIKKKRKQGGPDIYICMSYYIIHIQYKHSLTCACNIIFILYIYNIQGMAGAGKSSFVAKLVPALASTVEELLDPEMDVRFVKQVGMRFVRCGCVLGRLMG
jgi:hypothetical protein